MNHYPEFEQNFYLRTAKSNFRNGQGSVRLKKWIASYDHFYENTFYFDLMASVLTCLKNISKENFI